jgi:hypothetical protein
VMAGRLHDRTRCVDRAQQAVLIFARVRKCTCVHVKCVEDTIDITSIETVALRWSSADCSARPGIYASTTCVATVVQ